MRLESFGAIFTTPNLNRFKNSNMFVSMQGGFLFLLSLLFRIFFIALQCYQLEQYTIAYNNNVYFWILREVEHVIIT